MAVDTTFYFSTVPRLSEKPSDLDPGAVDLSFKQGQLSIEISGNWASITHFEIFLLSIISELHCRNSYSLNEDDGVEQQGKERLEQKLACLDGLKNKGWVRAPFSLWILVLEDGTRENGRNM